MHMSLSPRKRKKKKEGGEKKRKKKKKRKGRMTTAPNPRSFWFYGAELPLKGEGGKEKKGGKKKN